MNAIAPKKNRNPSAQAMMLTHRMAEPILKASEMIPAIIGAKAAPLFSMKYSTDCAVARTSGTMTS